MLELTREHFTEHIQGAFYRAHTLAIYWYLAKLTLFWAKIDALVMVHHGNIKNVTLEVLI